MQRRRFLRTSLGAAGVISLAGCNQNREQDTESGEGRVTTTDGDTGGAEGALSSTEALVADYYDAVSDGRLERAAEQLALTELEEDGGSVEVVTELLAARGMSDSGTDAEIGPFEELSVSEFADFRFEDEDGEAVPMDEDRANELLRMGTGFGADSEELRIVHHTGGFVPEVWVPYQPTPDTFESEYPDGWGEVVIQIGTYGNRPLIVGDFRSYVNYKIISE